MSKSCYIIFFISKPGHCKVTHCCSLTYGNAPHLYFHDYKGQV